MTFPKPSDIILQKANETKIDLEFNVKEVERLYYKIGHIMGKPYSKTNYEKVRGLLKELVDLSEKIRKEFLEFRDAVIQFYDSAHAQNLPTLTAIGEQILDKYKAHDIQLTGNIPIIDGWMDCIKEDYDVPKSDEDFEEIVRKVKKELEDLKKGFGAPPPPSPCGEKTKIKVEK